MTPITKVCQKAVAAAGSLQTACWRENKGKRSAPNNTELKAHARKATLALRKAEKEHGYRHGLATAQAIEQGGRQTADGGHQGTDRLASPADEAWCQRFPTNSVARLIRKGNLPDEWILVSLISASDQVPIDKLTCVSPGGGTATAKQAVERFAKVVKVNNVAIAMAGLDLSLNCPSKAEIRNGMPPYWQVHITALIPKAEHDRILPTLKLAYPKTPSIPKPRRATDWHGDPAGIAYVLKRLADPKARLKRETLSRKKKADGTHARQNSRKTRLSRDRYREVIVMLDQLAPALRYILHGLRFENGPKGLRLMLG